MKLNPKNFGLASGIVWGVGLFLLTLISLATGYGTVMLNVLVSMYPGYTVSLVGSIVGLIYGFIDAFIWVYILVWVYNYLEKRK